MSKRYKVEKLRISPRVTGTSFCFPSIVNVVFAFIHSSLLRTRWVVRSFHWC